MRAITEKAKQLDLFPKAIIHKSCPETCGFTSCNGYYKEKGCRYLTKSISPWRARGGNPPAAAGIVSVAEMGGARVRSYYQFGRELVIRIRLICGYNNVYDKDIYQKHGR